MQIIEKQPNNPKGIEIMEKEVLTPEEFIKQQYGSSWRTRDWNLYPSDIVELLDEYTVQLTTDHKKAIELLGKVNAENERINFWKRLEAFVSNVQVNDPASEEEKDMILYIARKRINTNYKE
jgi:hypothetical protein